MNLNGTVEEFALTYPLYQKRKPTCVSDGAVAERKDKGTYVCLKCSAEYVVPVEVLLREAGARPLL